MIPSRFSVASRSWSSRECGSPRRHPPGSPKPAMTSASRSFPMRPAWRDQAQRRCAFRVLRRQRRDRSEDRVPPPAHGSDLAASPGFAASSPSCFTFAVPSRRSIIPLSGAAGKTFRCDDAEFTIQSVDDSPTATNVAMTVRLNVDKADLPDKPDPS